MKLVLMASNNGHLLDELHDDILLVITNKSRAPVLERANSKNIPAAIINNFETLERILDNLHTYDYILMCGYMRILPKNITDKYVIFNTHPSDLPKYAGMMGRQIHRKVLENGDTETAVCLHRVNEIVDGGEVVARIKVPVEPGDTVETLEARVKQAEKKMVKEYFNNLKNEEIQKCL
jgi:phosphoribosylglycinamide formyltransferase-1